MKISDTIQSKFLKASDLQGKEVKVEIEDCRMEALGSGDDVDSKPVLYFRGKKKGLVLNLTKREQLKAAFGDETDEWSGRTLLLYPDMTDFKGKMVDCIRIRPFSKTSSDDPPAEF